METGAHGRDRGSGINGTPADFSAPIRTGVGLVFEIGGSPHFYEKGAAAAVLGVLLGIWGYWFYSRPYDAVRLVQCLPQDRSLHVYMNIGLLRSAGILDLLAGSQGTEEADYKKFVEQTGFDYRTDLDAVAAGIPRWR